MAGFKVLHVFFPIILIPQRLPLVGSLRLQCLHLGTRDTHGGEAGLDSFYSLARLTDDEHGVIGAEVE